MVMMLCSCGCSTCYCVFFFFKAEDAIRDYKVTGVQTCALPIYAGHEQLQQAEGEEVERSRDQEREKISVGAAVGERPAEAPVRRQPGDCPERTADADQGGRGRLWEHVGDDREERRVG